ncbi:MAG: class II fumarate hydratase [Thermoplasmatota archaeon]
MTEGATRVEKDTMGEVRVPAHAFWGAQTQRAVDNFPISGRPLPPRFIHAIALVKLAAARVNRADKHLEGKLADAIETAAREVADGKYDDQFPIDVYQTGSGTSSNMNANEVIAHRAMQILAGHKGPSNSFDPTAPLPVKVHPNDHVNMGQSSNDVIPTAVHVSAVLAIEQQLLPALRELHEALEAKSLEFDPIVTVGRTHLMDAVPIRLGQQFSGWTSQVAHSIRRVENALPDLRELAIGGTAVGTGLNTSASFGEDVARELTALTGTQFLEARNHFEAQAAQDASVGAAHALAATALSLTKIANDIRLLSSGPEAGIGEIVLPAIQPGSSIMPGKVNPVLCESVVQVSAQVVGLAHAVELGGQYGPLDLNTMLPLIGTNLLDATHLLTNVSRVFAQKAVSGIKANRERAEGYVERSISMATALNPLIGYEKAAAIAKESAKTGRTVREIAYEKSGLTKQQVDAALEPRKQTERGTGAGGSGGG